MLRITQYATFLVLQHPQIFPLADLIVRATLNSSQSPDSGSNTVRLGQFFRLWRDIGPMYRVRHDTSSKVFWNETQLLYGIQAIRQ